MHIELVNRWADVGSPFHAELFGDPGLAAAADADEVHR